jgi:hypothetical protein
VSLRRLRLSKGGLTAGQKSAEGIVGQDVGKGCGSHSGQIFENLIEQAVEGCPKRGRGDAQNGD